MATYYEEFLEMGEAEAREQVEKTIAEVLSNGEQSGVWEKSYRNPPDDMETFTSVPELNDRERKILKKYIQYLLSNHERVSWRRIEDGLDILQVVAGERRGAGIHRVGEKDQVYDEMMEKLLSLFNVESIEHVDDGPESRKYDNDWETQGRYFIAHNSEWLEKCPARHDVNPESVRWDIYSGIFFDYPYEAILGFMNPGTMRKWLNNEIFISEAMSVPPEESGYLAYVPYYYGSDEDAISRRIQDGKRIRERLETIADLVGIPEVTRYLDLLYRHRVEASIQVRPST